MIGPIDPRAYDFEGRITALPDKKRLHFKPTFAMGTYLSSPLAVRCTSIEEIRAFLKTCVFVSDRAQFGKGDHWMRPSEFEKARKGDCDDFALWTWRQLLQLGHDARFVIGRVGYRRKGHAWVTFQVEGDHFLLESTAAERRKLARLSVTFYEPMVSVAVSEGKLVFREHRSVEFTPPILETFSLAAEWLPPLLAGQARDFLLFPWRFLKRSLGARNA